jgi:hypothetical protein
MPMVMSLGIGLAVNNAHAVLEAVLGRSGEFRRTPKYSVGNRPDDWKKKGYRTRVNASFVFEITLAIYFAIAIAISVEERIYLAIPFLMIFFSGYFYMTMLTLAQQFSTPRLPRLAAAPSPALTPAAETHRESL